MARIGIDIVEVAQVAASIATFGDRYVGRIYTARERADAGGSPERLAARFAAKEAFLKILSPGDRGIDLRSIEIVRDEGRAPRLALSGTARALAVELGLEAMEVSLSHDGGYATAVVLAESKQRSPSRRSPSRGLRGHGLRRTRGRRRDACR